MSGSTAENRPEAPSSLPSAAEDAGGKVAGAELSEVVAADHQNKPDVGSAIARQWLDRDNVSVMVDLPFTQIALAVAGIAKERDRPIMVDAAASSDLTGPACSPVLTHWTDDTYALANGTARALTKAGGKTWFFITADYAFGEALQRDATSAITAEGGRVVGSVRHPLPSADMSSYITQAMSSGAAVVGLANVGTDTSNAIKQAAEFGLGSERPEARGASRVHQRRACAGPAGRAGAERHCRLLLGPERHLPRFCRAVPGADRQGAIKVAGSGIRVGPTLAARGRCDREHLGEADHEGYEGGAGRATFGQSATIREDGRVIYDLGLYQVKSPEESRGPWDYYRQVAVIPAAEAFRPLAEGKCPMVGQK